VPRRRQNIENLKKAVAPRSGLQTLVRRSSALRAWAKNEVKIKNRRISDSRMLLRSCLHISDMSDGSCKAWGSGDCERGVEGLQFGLARDWGF
jgi:hypothetical protein